MTFKVIHVNPYENEILFRHICKHLFAYWRVHYVNLFDDVTNVDELIEYYKSHYMIKTFAVIDTDINTKDQREQFVGCYSTLEKDNVCWLTDVYVIVSKRKMGVGKLIVMDVQSKHDVIALHAQQHLVPYYESFGFRVNHHHETVGKYGEVFRYYDMIYTKPSESTKWTMYVIILTLIGLGLVSIILLL